MDFRLIQKRKWIRVYGFFGTFVLGLLPVQLRDAIRARIVKCANCYDKIAKTDKPAVNVQLAESGTKTQFRVNGRAQTPIPTDEPAIIRVTSPPSTAFSGQVLDISKGGLKLRLDDPLDPGSLVQVELRNAMATAEIRYCEAALAGFHVGVRLDQVVLGKAIERRSEARIATDDPCFVQLLNPLAPGRLPAKILDTSKRGICLGSAMFLPRGAEVCIFLENVQLFGTIRYCASAREGYRAGIELTGRIQPPRAQSLQIAGVGSEVADFIMLLSEHGKLF